jgi:8-oxo-dGTP diphosphatase
MENQLNHMQKLNDIEWNTWIPKQQATLLFVVRDGKVLLIHKKRGLGAGNINGPGGRLEADETPLQAAIREVQEELCITPLDVSYCGELYFQFVDGLTIHGTVFRASDFEGQPTETDEAKPCWTPLDQIPYDQMWEDDQHWVPLMLDNKIFHGYFIFDGPKMLDMRVDTENLPAGDGSTRRYPLQS